MDKIKDLDLYLLLGVNPDADQAVIKKAYRKKALTCHPDKNPDNPKAADLFSQLSEALAVLTDEKAKATYDKLLKARKRREIKGATKGQIISECLFLPPKKFDLKSSQIKKM